MSNNRTPEIVIKTGGTFTEIFVNGKKLDGVIDFCFTHDKKASQLPVLKIGLIATNVTLEAEMFPALPDLYSKNYISINSLLNSGKIPDEIISDICRENGIELIV